MTTHFPLERLDHDGNCHIRLYWHSEFRRVYATDDGLHWIAMPRTVKHAATAYRKALVYFG